MMDCFEMKEALGTMIILADTREQDTKLFGERMKQTGYPYQRQKLDSGDYSCSCTLPGGTVLNFSNRVVIERKMNLDEICQNFTRGRSRFIREFDRLKEKGGKPYLLIENACWEDVYEGNYRSLFHPNALLASLMAWCARYNAHLVFCKPETSGKLIGEILYRELKEYLEGGEADEILRTAQRIS